MPATVYTISAVNTATDQLTITAHGLTTGDGFLAVYSPDGGTPPAPLAAVTDYWIIRDSADLVRLATSSANAMSGAAINLTSTGSGTLQLLRGLPYRRPRIAANLQQVYADDLNQVWLALVGLWNLTTGQAQSIWSGVKLAGTLDVAGLATLATLSAADVALTGPVKLTGIVTPSALSAGNNNNYNPTGLSTANVLRVGAASGSPFITGIAGGTSGRVLHIVNVDTDDIVITHEDGSSTAANRFHLPNSTSFVTIRDGGTMTVWYDGTSSRWRPLSQNL